MTESNLFSTSLYVAVTAKCTRAIETPRNHNLCLEKLTSKRFSKVRKADWYLFPAENHWAPKCAGHC